VPPASLTAFEAKRRLSKSWKKNATVSIGSKFNLLALGIPIVGLLILLGLIYLYAPSLTQASLVLVGGFLALDGVVWNRLRSHLGTKLLEVWDHYLKEINYDVGGIVRGGSYYFPIQGLRQKIDWVSKYGKYGVVRLYPRKLVKLELVPRLLKAGEEFNSKLDKFLATTTVEGYKVERYFAFDRWGLRKIPPDQIKGLDASQVVTQKTILDELDKTKKQEIDGIIESWKEPFNLARALVSILDRFSSENGIMPPKPDNPFDR